jgi:hypothetical protein
MAQSGPEDARLVPGGGGGGGDDDRHLSAGDAENMISCLNVLFFFFFFYFSYHSEESMFSLMTISLGRISATSF